MFQSNAIEVRDLGRLMLRRRGVLTASVLGFLGLALALNVFTRPVFRTAARLEIQPAPSRSPLTGAAVESPTTVSENLALLTTAERILTRDVLEHVVRDVESRGVTLDPRCKAPGDSTHAFNVLSALSLGGDAKADEFSPAERLAANVDWLQHNVSIRPIRDTRLVDIQAEHCDPRAAADIANTVAAMFLRAEADSRHAADAERLNSLRAQIADVRAVIENSEKTLYGSPSASLTLAGERKGMLTQAGTELSSNVLRARSDLHAVEAQMDRIREFRKLDSPDWSNPPIQTPAMDDRYRELQKVETQMLALKQVYRDGTPELAALDAQARALREAMRKEVQKAFSDLEGQQALLEARTRDLEGALSRNDRSIKTLSDSSYKYSTLESELSTQRDLYTLLLKKVQEQDIAQMIQPPGVEVVQAAAVPLEAVRPRKLVNVIVGLLLGFVTGAGIALALEAFRRTIRTPRDVVQLLHLPVMGMIPRRM